VAGPLDIQRPARGLTDLLGLRALGESPKLMAEAITGTLDLLGLYALDRRTSSESITSGAIAGVGFSAFTFPTSAIAVQPGTAFLVYSAFFWYPVPAVSTWAGALCVRRAAFTTLQGYTYIDGTDRIYNASEGVHLGRYFERPLVLLPGDQLGVLTRSFSGSGSTPALELDYALISV